MERTSHQSTKVPLSDPGPGRKGACPHVMCGHTTSMCGHTTSGPLRAGSLRGHFSLREGCRGVTTGEHEQAGTDTRAESGQAGRRSRGPRWGAPASRSAWGTRADCSRRRASAPSRVSRWPAWTAEPGARASPHPRRGNRPHVPRRVDLGPRHESDLSDRAAVSTGTPRRPGRLTDPSPTRGVKPCPPSPGR